MKGESVETVEFHDASATHKRKMDFANVTRPVGDGSRDSGSSEVNSFRKRVKGGMREDNVDMEADKENFHRTRDLVPRTRRGRALAALIVDAPTDCSDIEISMEHDISPFGSLYRDLQARVTDKKNSHHHFSVYVDSP
jgi:hypothetical protein